MTDVFGTFILSESGGQYHGEFFNNKMKAFSKEEVSVLSVRANDPFVGSFETVWEEHVGPVTAILQCDLESENIYMLTWTEVKIDGELQNINFTGRGTIRNGELTAVYSMHSLHVEK